MALFLFWCFQLLSFFLHYEIFFSKFKRNFVIPLLWIWLIYNAIHIHHLQSAIPTASITLFGWKTSRYSNVDIQNRCKSGNFRKWRFNSKISCHYKTISRLTYLAKLLLLILMDLESEIFAVFTYTAYNILIFRLCVFNVF